MRSFFVSSAGRVMPTSVAAAAVAVATVAVLAGGCAAPLPWQPASSSPPAESNAQFVGDESIDRPVARGPAPQPVMDRTGATPPRGNLAAVAAMNSADANRSLSIEDRAALPIVGSRGGGSADAPVINLFGELNGRSNQTGPAGTEVAFQQHTWSDEGHDADVAITPDAQHLIFSSTRHSADSNLYLQRVDGLSVTQLTSDPAEDAFPAVSPDGKQVAFASTRAGNWDLYVMDINGRAITQVTSGPAQDLHPSFSPDGKRLVYCSLPARGNAAWELWVVNLETGQRSMIGHGLFPSWSPERSRDRIAFQRARQRGSRWFSLWTLDLVNNQATRVTEVAVSSNAAIVSPSWSADGRRIVFGTIVDPAGAALAAGPQGAAVAPPVQQQDIWTIHADGSGRLRLTDGVGVNTSPTWGSDGRVYFVSSRGGNESIWSTPVDASATLTAQGEPQTPGQPPNTGMGNLPMSP